MSGHCEAGFEPVAELFERKLTTGEEAGCAFAVSDHGKCLVDLYGGSADTFLGRPWTEDTLASVFSGSKGLMATSIMRLADRGLLDIRAPVADYWPEFATSGKGAVLLTDVLTHRARMPAMRTPVSHQDMLDPVAMASRLAMQAQEDSRFGGFTYHQLTVGWLCDALVRRVDGRSLGRFFDEEIAGPLDIEVWIGLPQTLLPRVSTLEYGAQWYGVPGYLTQSEPQSQELATLVLRNPEILPEGEIPWNQAQFRRAEVAAAGAIGSASGMARLYDCLSQGGILDGVRLARSETVAEFTTCWVQQQDTLTGDEMAFGLGFSTLSGYRSYGPVDRAFGHAGAGGSLHGAWPQWGIGFSYCMNRLIGGPDDRRAIDLLDVLHTCLVDRRRLQGEVG